MSENKLSKKIAVLAGDGIGPEVIAQAIKVLNAIEKVSGHSFLFKEALVGAIAIDATGNPLPDETIEICKNSDAILFGAIGHPKYDNDPNAPVRPEQGLLKLRKTMGRGAEDREHIGLEADDRHVGREAGVVEAAVGAEAAGGAAAGAGAGAGARAAAAARERAAGRERQRGDEEGREDGDRESRVRHGSSDLARGLPPRGGDASR